MADLDKFQSLDRKGDRVLIVSDGLAQGFHAPSSSTLGVFNLREGSGWTRDGRDFLDDVAWREHIDALARLSW